MGDEVRRAEKEDESAARRIVNDAKDARDKTAAIAKDAKSKISEKVAYANKVVGDTVAHGAVESKIKNVAATKDKATAGIKDLKDSKKSTLIYCDYMIADLLTKALRLTKIKRLIEDCSLGPKNWRCRGGVSARQKPYNELLLEEPCILIDLSCFLDLCKVRTRCKDTIKSDYSISWLLKSLCIKSYSQQIR
ncbi:hypothetical protein K0M31_001867 [Melipona bicolor]|uniref:Uncharacterized protein n=1 Tax=Melipona bicolor TaxID=60889 RepID=A0AA40GGG1_9HYME|nr:hypothetical protein K0M31_001867 [Melipona bicolor]